MRIVDGAAGCITSDTRTENFRDWLLVHCSITSVLGLGRNKPKDRTHGWNSILLRHLGRPRGRQVRRPHRHQRGRLRPPAAPAPARPNPGPPTAPALATDTTP